MTGLFNPEALLQQQIDGAMDTKYPTVPAGEWPAIIGKLKIDQKPSKEDPSKIFTWLEVTFNVEDAGVKTATKLDQPTVRDSVFLDLATDPATGQEVLDRSTGKNVQLGRLREALDMNDPNVPFKFDLLVGKPCIIKVIHQPNPKDATNPYANVESVAPMA